MSKRYLNIVFTLAGGRSSPGVAVSLPNRSPTILATFRNDKRHEFNRKMH
jgi:hypothetical protein